MPLSMDVRSRIEAELQHAEAARARGNEGMARVCARRAAGWSVGAYLKEQGIDLNTTSVLDPMRHLLNMNARPAEATLLLEHMLMPKLKDDLESDSYFPEGIDLIAEARQLIAILFP